MVSVPAASRRGTVTAAIAGPTIAGQSASTWAVAGARRRKAGRVSRGTSAPIGPRPIDMPFVAVHTAVCGFSATALLTWYDRHRRSLPWRSGPGETPDPYHVWLSEIMLQQTTVTATIPYYERFLRRFPTVAGVGRRPARGRARRLGRPWLLRPRAQPARLRPGGGRGRWIPA